ncbi:Phi92_gp047 [Klebsiella phage vB_KvM-Eowyn]|uniref:Phi92_gp047 n=1 Tax=Klebsiella phage vB_KvM-Eowyn TaxID=2762819 RepID=A0A7R8R5D7_9CAUD|nr:Phi92_gp047 [Klebsiella phage vB_KvM-Eowyn]CAD5236035.1 Phi92_gp047 [Klebsiella phage vB_KvM-Eowyn]
MKYVTVVGSREVSVEEYLLMVELGMWLSYYYGFYARSGKATGSDQAWQRGFEIGDALRGRKGHHQIFLGWPSFEWKNGKTSDRYDIVPEKDALWEKATEIASRIHPAWDKVKPGGRLQHTRNVYQQLGPELNSPSELCLYCADDDKHGVPKGGTRTAVMLAREYGIPLLNIRGKTLDEAKEWVYKHLLSNA